MLLINSITDDPLQTFVLDGIPGVSISVLLRFMPRIQKWNMDLTYGSFTANGIPLLCGPNIVRQWRNLLPFGIAITNQYFLDPYTLQEFAAGTSSFYLLNSEEAAAVEAQFFA